DDPPKYAFPRVAVTVDESRNQDGIRCIDHLARYGEIGADRGDLLSLNQHVSFDEITDLRIHADNGSTLKQDAAIGIAISARVTFDDCRFFGLTQRRRHGPGEGGADLNEAASRSSAILGICHTNLLATAK